MIECSDSAFLERMLRVTRTCCFYWSDAAYQWVASPGVGEALGLPPDWQPWSMADWWERLHRDDRAAFLPELDALSRGEAFTPRHVRLKEPRLGWRRFRCEGHADRFLVLTDVTVTTQVEAALHDSQSRLTGLYDAAPVAIILWSREGRITGWNRTAEESFGHGRDAVVGEKLVPKLIAPTAYAAFSRSINDALTQNTCADLVCDTLTARGEVLQCCWRSVPLRSRKGALTGIFSLVLDVTAELAAAEGLRRAKESAERLSQAKSEFLAVVSHELRTPLNGMLGVAQLLETFPLEVEVAELVRTIGESGTNLLQIINAIVTYAQVDLVLPEDCRSVFSPADLVVLACERPRYQAARKGLQLVVELAPDLPPSVCSDEEAWRTALDILLDNAIKFSEQGTVQVRMQSAASGLLLEVRDQGVGMTPEFMAQLYTPFRQAENAIVRKHGGVGLGLALARKLVDRMGGQIAVESAPGLGACFRVSLPVFA